MFVDTVISGVLESLGYVMPLSSFLTMWSAVVSASNSREPGFESGAAVSNSGQVRSLTRSAV